MGGTSVLRNSRILYSGDEAEFLSRLQELWRPDEDEKTKVILRHLGGAESLPDLGSGPGQLLKGAQDCLGPLVDLTKNLDK